MPIMNTRKPKSWKKIFFLILVVFCIAFVGGYISDLLVAYMPENASVIRNGVAVTCLFLALIFFFLPLVKEFEVPTKDSEKNDLE